MLRNKEMVKELLAFSDGKEEALHFKLFFRKLTIFHEEGKENPQNETIILKCVLLEILYFAVVQQQIDFARSLLKNLVSNRYFKGHGLEQEIQDLLSLLEEFFFVSGKESPPDFSEDEADSEEEREIPENEIDMSQTSILLEILHFSVISENAAFVHSLLYYSAQLRQDSIVFKDSPLPHAVFTQNVKIIQLLLDNNFSPNQSAKMKFSDFPLLEAIVKENIAIVDLLLKHGADPNYPSQYGDLPLKRALYSKNHKEMIPLLVQYGADPYKNSIYAAMPEALKSLAEQTYMTYQKTHGGFEKSLWHNGILRTFVRLQHKKVFKLWIRYGSNLEVLTRHLKVPTIELDLINALKNLPTEIKLEIALHLTIQYLEIECKRTYEREAIVPEYLQVIQAQSGSRIRSNNIRLT